MTDAFDPSLIFHQSSTAAIVVALDDRWTILDVNDAYLAVTHTARAIVGRGIFDAFPESLETTEEHGTHHVRSSFELAVSTRDRVVLPVQRYDIAAVDGSGRFEERYWELSSRPLLGANGVPVAVLHEVVNVTERERSRLVAERAEARIVEAFRQAPAFIAVLRGPTHVFEMVNERYLQLVGHRNVVGLSAVEAIPEVRDQGFIELLDGVLATGTPFVGEKLPILLQRVRGAPAEKRFLTFIYAPLTEPDGTRSGIFVNGMDVTDAVRASEQVQAVVESITDGFFAFDRDLRFTYVNERAAEMWGMPPSAMVGRTPFDIWPEMERSPFVHGFRRALTEGHLVAQEDFAVTLGRWIETRAYPAGDGGVVVFFQDITERRRAQGATAFLAEASRLLGLSADYAQTLSNLARAAVPTLGDWCAVDVLDDPDSAEWPPRLERVAVVHEDPLKMELGNTLVSEYPTDWSDEAGVPAVLRHGTPMFLPELTDAMLVAGARDARQLELLRALGFTSIIVVPLRARERILGSLTLCTSESKRRYTEADLALALDLGQRAGQALDTARLLRDAAAANAAKTEFLRTISHELRQPLNATMSFLQLWDMGLRGTLSMEQKDDLARMRRNQQHLMVLIEDLLSFTRLEAGKLEVERSRVRLRNVIEAVGSMVAPQMSRKGVEYHDEACGDDIHALGDEDRIVQVCLNLLTNALRATNPGGTVTLRCACTEDTVGLVVTDTGVGIPADKLDLVFSPFTQLGRALNQPKEGAGLGLAISRGLAEAMGGSLSATSEVGVGSSFELRLPRE
ncbi:MAG: ATP-binding region ATPase domain protein [Gemmatimonadetes bacterium]|nr:ATP-binding region ATPase domain protein [Gemmatimonadota bacterium]